jgi:hypothetical protein
MAIIWARLFGYTRRALFREACERAVGLVAATQSLSGPPETRGAIAGSYPIWGAYARFEFPNWAAKFFVDAVAALEHSTAPAPVLAEQPACA